MHHTKEQGHKPGLNQNSSNGTTKEINKKLKTSKTIIETLKKD